MWHGRNWRGKKRERSFSRGGEILLGRIPRLRKQPLWEWSRTGFGVFWGFCSWEIQDVELKKGNTLHRRFSLCPLRRTERFYIICIFNWWQLDFFGLFSPLLWTKLLLFEHPQILWQTQQKTWFPGQGKKPQNPRLWKPGDKNNTQERATKSQLNCFCSSVQVKLLQQQHCQQKWSLCWAVFWGTFGINGNFLFQNSYSTCASAGASKTTRKYQFCILILFPFQWSNVVYTFRPRLEQNISHSRDFFLTCLRLIDLENNYKGSGQPGFKEATGRFVF